jgi:hypothetical protein
LTTIRGLCHREGIHPGTYYPGCNVRVPTTTREIIQKYYQWKLNKGQNEENPIADDEVGEQEELPQG